ncbi:four-carbon acid sugar kinase family protein [Salmonella enterica]|nr:four-carbon acid sugar kinase family protein [Salmonella enterica]
MSISLGIIADDFTGATDIASFIAHSGWRVVQLNGLPESTVDISQTDAVVISLKSRSCPAEEAKRLSQAACEWLQSSGCRRIYFKYCSTFDSTPAGNIGPVTDLLLELTQAPMAVLCPALPVNGRSVVYGHLFVHGQLLNKSGMQNHPLTPMTDAYLPDVMERQSVASCGLVSLADVRAGKKAVIERIHELRQQNKRYVVLDAMNEDDLRTLAGSLPDDVLLTGGSGLAGAIAALNPKKNNNTDISLPSPDGKGLVLAGSCSSMTNLQVSYYRQRAPSLAIDIERTLYDSSAYLEELVLWYLSQAELPAPMIYATRPAEDVRRIQMRYGSEAVGTAVESLIAALASRLTLHGVNKMIVAGGETSSLLVQKLGVSGFIIGKTIAPGVPWVKDISGDRWLALKSGNFGDEHFFIKAQEIIYE